jgi:HAE1 family hydrophobic/amphiphilic exporter-1
MKPAFAVYDISMAWLMRNHPKALDKAMKKPGKLICIVFVVFLISLALFTQLGGELIPEMFQGQFYTDIRFAAGTPIEKVDSELSFILKDIRKLEQVEEIYTVSGTTSKTGGNRNEQRENLAQVFVFLKSGSNEKDEQYIIAKMRNKLQSYPGLEFEFGRPSFFSYKTPVEVYIQGRNLDILNDLSARLKKKMDAIPGLVDVRSSMEGGNPEAQIRFDRVKLAAIGTDLSSVASLIRTKVLGDVPSEFVRLDRKIGIRIRADEQYRKNLKNLEDLNIAPTGDKPIPLKSVADIKIDRGPVEIRRVSQERTALITANLKDTDLASASEKINTVMNSIRMPEGYTVEIGGQRKEMSSSFRSLMFAISLAIFLVYLVMASSFESLLHPFVIMFTIPFALIGVVFILLIFGLTINVVVLIGMILLAGIVVNNAIVLIDYTNQLRATGMEKKAALKKAAQVRMRPILMTTLTTVLGLLPMAISTAEGSELRIPMALTVIGGLSFATILTLIVIPSVYIVLDRKK